MDLNGSMEYRLTWKNLAMPSGRVIFRLRASGRPISDSGYGGWPTPSAMDAGNTGTSWIERRKRVKAKLGNGNGFGLILPMAAQLVGWPTPNANERGPESRESKDKRGAGGIDLQSTAKLAGWATPDAQAMNVGADPEKHIARLDRLREKHGNGNGAGCTLGAQAGMISGLILTSAGVASQVEVESGAVLTPAHSLWLQGYPKQWASCGARAMRSIRGSRRSSSDPT
jgi:hypothetical protein